MQSSEKLVIADANVLLAATSNRAAIKVFQCEIEVYTTEFTCGEVVEYFPYFSKRYGISIESMYHTLEKLPLIVKPKEYYASKLLEVEVFVKDPEDHDVGALALFENVPVWSNDNDFKNFPTGRYTTAELLKSLGL